MKVVIQCGGLGTRLSEETTLRPKPMVDVGDKPILLHIMNIYSHFGIKDFVLALGYKGEYIKDFFINFHSLNSDFTVNMKSGDVEHHNHFGKDWNVSLINTGLHTLTGGRILRLKEFLKDSGTFMLTYGDGVADVDIAELIKFHKSHGKIATVTAVRPTARFGHMEFNGQEVTNFSEKSQSKEGWINGGFFIFEPEIFDYIEGDSTILERDPLEKLVKENNLMAYNHHGFWHCMDTIRDKNNLNELWNSGNAPWNFDR